MITFNHLCGVILLFQGRSISRGKGSGPLLLSPAPISFLSGVDPDTGLIVETGHPLKGTCIKGTVLVFPYGKGSTVGSYILYALGRNGHAPAAIINSEAETIIATGAIIGNIPMVDHISLPEGSVKNGMRATVDGDAGTVSIEPA